MKKSFGAFALFLGGMICLILSFATPATTGLEASAAADQVKTGGSYLQARAEMEFWPRILRMGNIVGGVLVFIGAVAVIVPEKKKP